jgi:3-deoxy-D-manno-octulosonic-acid transferase
MIFIYNLAIQLYVFAIRLSAMAGNKKASLWIGGRKNWREKMRQDLRPGERRIWFHCSSLGEFEQARPVMEKLKSDNAETKIVLSFFSPSGFEVRKNYAGADYIFYLPADTYGNAKDFVELINPSTVFFTKYEYWHYYFHRLKQQKIPLYMVSAIFRNGDRFFKWYGGFFRNMLKCVTHFFVQENDSQRLLSEIGFKNVTVAGDTRFDRVVQAAGNPKEIAIAKKFSEQRIVMVAGSTWNADEKLLSEMFKGCGEKFKMIIAPHEISASRIEEVKGTFSDMRTQLYSTASELSVADAEVLIIDNIGMLSSLYRYGSMAYVGGGFGKGIHNTLEAAVFGIPVFFGPNFKKFNEAKELIACGGAYSVNNADDLIKHVNLYLVNENDRQAHGKAAGNYVRSNAGVTNKILKTIPALARVPADANI